MKLTFAIILTFIFAGLCSGQTVKTDEARRLKELDKSIAEYEKTLKNATEALDKLRVDYTAEAPEVKKLTAMIAELKSTLAPLYLERKNLLTKQMIRNLPNNQIELLKIIIQQNEKIIDLLEKMSP